MINLQWKDNPLIQIFYLDGNALLAQIVKMFVIYFQQHQKYIFLYILYHLEYYQKVFEFDVVDEI